MNSGLTIEVPEGIANLPNVSLAEAVALSHILEHPRCTNRNLARLVRQTERGVEAMLYRLRERELIRVEGSGRGRRIVLTFHVEHKKCGQRAGVQLPIKCGDPNIITLAKRDSLPADSISIRVEFYSSCMSAGNYDAARSHLVAIRESIQGESSISDSDKKIFLHGIKVTEDRCIAFALGAKAAEALTLAEQARLAVALSTAPVEKLAALRERAEARALRASGDTPLLGEVIEKELLT